MPNPPKAGLFVVMGVAGAGKSLIGALFALELAVPFVDGDDYHPRRNVEKMAAGIPLTDDDRAEWLTLLGQKLREADEGGSGLVVACSALKRSYRDTLRREAGAEVRFVYLRGPRATIAERMAQRRGHFMPASLLDSQRATLEEPAGDEDAWVVDVRETPERIVADLMQRAAHRVA